MKKIAYIRTSNIYDDSRATKEIVVLAEQGFFVDIYGWNRNGLAEEQTKLLFGKYNNVNTFFYNSDAKNGIGLKNIHKLLGWFFWISKKIRNEEYGIVHACNLDSVLSIANYCRKNKIKIIYDIFDYYVDSHKIPAILRGYVENIETKIINESFSTIICTEERIEQIKNASPKNIVVIYNSPDLENMPVVELESDYTYCGVLAQNRLIGKVLEKYKENSDLKFFFAGYGEYELEAKLLAASYKNFTFAESIPYSVVIDKESKSRVLAAIYEPTIRNHRLCAPNKFYEALALGKPQIVCRGTGIDKIVEKYDIGIVIEYDVKQFYDALRYLLNNKNVCLDMGKRARRLYESKYNWKICKDKIKQLYIDALK